MFGSVRVLEERLDSSDPSGVVGGVGGAPGFRFSLSTAWLLSRSGWCGEWGWIGMADSSEKPHALNARRSGSIQFRGWRWATSPTAPRRSQNRIDNRRPHPHKPRLC